MSFNVFYLIVGVLSILFSFTHGWNGQTGILHSIDVVGIDAISKTTVFYVWHIITAENLIFGIAFLVMAFYKDASKVKFAAWMIAIIIMARWGVILGSILLKNIDGLGSTLMDSIAIIVFAGLIILGTRKTGSGIAPDF
jgi:hypothetical protein